MKGLLVERSIPAIIDPPNETLVVRPEHASLRVLAGLVDMADPYSALFCRKTARRGRHTNQEGLVKGPLRIGYLQAGRCEIPACPSDPAECGFRSEVANRWVSDGNDSGEAVCSRSIRCDSPPSTGSAREEETVPSIVKAVSEGVRCNICVDHAPGRRDSGEGWKRLGCQ